MIENHSPMEPIRGYGPCAIYEVMSQFMYEAHDPRNESVSEPIPQKSAIKERSIRHHFFSGCSSESIGSLGRLQLFRLLFLYFRPFVAEGDGTVEGENAVGGVGVNAEITKPLELIAGEGLGVFQGRLDKTISQNIERFGIQVGGEVLAFGGIVRVFFGEKIFIQSDFDWYGVFGRDPVNCRFDFSAIWCIPPFCCGVVGAMQFDDVAGIIFYGVCALDEICVAEADFFAGA